MSYLNAEPAGGDVYLSSPPPASVNPGYHTILGAVKRWTDTPPSGGSMGRHRSVGKMIVKLAY
jgi:hypothetical protein